MEVVYNVFGIPQLIIVREPKVRFQEPVDYFISDTNVVTAIVFMLDGNASLTTTSNWDRRRWPRPASNFVDRNRKLSKFFADPLYISR